MHVPNKIFKLRHFWGTSPGISKQGDAYPPGGDAHAARSVVVWIKITLNDIIDMKPSVRIIYSSEKSPKLSETFGMFRKDSEMVILRENGKWLSCPFWEFPEVLRPNVWLSFHIHRSILKVHDRFQCQSGTSTQFAPRCFFSVKMTLLSSRMLYLYYNYSIKIPKQHAILFKIDRRKR